MWILLLACSTAPDDTSAGSDTSVADSFPLADELQSLLDELNDKQGAAGVTAAVRVDGYPPWTGATGLANLETEEALTPDHRLKIASVTKVLTATVVLQLAEQGVLGLDDRLDAWYADFPHGQITLRQLLDHSAGVPEYSATSAFQQSADEAWTDPELVALVADQPLAFEPGERMGYSNTHYVLLALVIEAATGQTWQDEVRSRVFEPTGVTACDVPDQSAEWGDIARGYIDGVDYTDSILPSGISAAGNGVCSAAELALWGEAVFGGGLLGELAEAERVAEPQALGGGVGYGLGVIILGSGTTVELAHNGALNGYASWMGHRPEQGATVVVTANEWTWVRTTSSYDYGYPLEFAEGIWSELEGLLP